MELVESYVVNLKNKRNNKWKEKLMAGVWEEWLPFHESDDHTISVIAGRNTGKTYNLVLKAALSDHDCVIYLSGIYLRQAIVELLQKFQSNFDPIDYNNMSKIIYKSGRSIEIREMLRTYRLQKEPSWINKVILFDEFDRLGFDSIINEKKDEISKAKQIACVGSSWNTDDTFAKRWFKSSKVYYFVDSKSLDYYSSYLSISEMTPSVMSKFIETLPLLDE